MTSLESIDTLAIGRVKGAGETTYEFNYITPTQTNSKVGEYIYYKVKINSESTATPDFRKVLCRVSAITLVRHYSEQILANPTINPAFIANTINYESEGLEIYEITAQILGYFDRAGENFVNPRALPRTGEPIYLAEKTDLESWLFRKGPDENWGANIGKILNRKEENVQVVLDVDKITSTHLAILAATGSGKSYTVGVILEELMMAKNRGAILVFDPHGEYKTFPEITSHLAFKDIDGYSPECEVIEPENIHIKFSELAFSEIIHMLEGLSDKMRYVLRRELALVRKENPNYGVQDLIDALEEAQSKADKDENNTITGILWRIFEFIKNRSLISDVDHKRLPDLLKPGKLTILEMVNLEERDQQLTTSVILSRILKSRIAVVRDNKDYPKDERLDYPVFIVLEEGHRFAPANDESSSKNIIKTILSEGRKFGIGVLIVSQRPGKLDSDVLSQCMTQIIMKITNPVDQQNIKNSVETVSSDIMTELPGLTRGQAIVAGDAINSPVMVQIRNRIIKHGGQSISTGKEWHTNWHASEGDLKEVYAPIKTKNKKLY